ncbi:zinc finger protein 14-like [Uloborus diversus]|uniref:zinc finger protein 14-like n=1 Tax=Uloborus diversus TaxID=327109 RepID=UPI002409ACC9|nr:zinc finger protein 14-like [Uloborus diversus]
MVDKSSEGKTMNDKKANSDRILDNVSSDEDDDFMQCEDCGVDFVDVKSYEQHLKGKKHQKAINRMKAMSKVGKMIAENGVSKSESDEENGSEIQCDVCQKSFSGHVPYYTHLKSNIHAKNLKKKKLQEQMKGLPEVLNHDDEKEESGKDDDDAIIPKPIAKCETCQKVFYGPESFHQHMKSSVHKKKIQQKAIVDTFNSQDKENNENAFTCADCSKSFSGPIPYMIHLKSATHEKEVNKAQVASEIKEFCKETDDKHIFVCKECEKKFTDPFALKAHLASNDHEKQKAKKEILQFLSSHPEIMMVEPVENLDSDEEADDLFFFVCKVCKVSLTGPESAKLHVSSKNHVSTMKNRKIVAHLKQKKAQADSKASEKNVQENGSKKIPSPSDNSNQPESILPPKDHSNLNNDDFELI